MKRKVEKWLIHAIATCGDCNFEESNYGTARRLGRNHYIKTGHTVTIETGYCQIYKSNNEE